jgi:SAM-dependent methyltransferase
MTEVELLIDLHRHVARQGPGGTKESLKAIQMAGLKPDPEMEIAEIGCGTGSSALLLARELQAKVTAIDLAPAFIDQLRINAEREGLDHLVTPQLASMEDLPFTEASLDVIWSEGAVYNIGFQKGISEWRRFLKPGGTLVVSEISWTSDDRPQEIQEFWTAAYPEIATAADKISQLETTGYTMRGHFMLPEYCWLDNYYLPVQQAFTDFIDRHSHDPKAQAIVDAMAEEIMLYEKFGAYYSYGMYVAQKACD